MRFGCPAPYSISKLDLVAGQPNALNACRCTSWLLLSMTALVSKYPGSTMPRMGIQQMDIPAFSEPPNDEGDDM